MTKPETKWLLLRDEILKDMGFEGLVESNECPSWAVEIADRLIDRGWVKP